jgi:hypothetical protein
MAGTPYYKDGATQRTITALYYKDGATQRTITEGWIGDGGTKRQFFPSAAPPPSVTVNVSNHSVNGESWVETVDTVPPTTINHNGTASFTVDSDGTLRWNASLSGGGASSGSYAGEWLATGAAADAQHRVTKLSGSASETGATRDLWTGSGASDKTYGISVSVPSSPNSNVYLLEFRNATDLSALGSCQITLGVTLV